MITNEEMLKEEPERLYVCAEDDCPHVCPPEMMVYVPEVTSEVSDTIKAGWYCELCYDELCFPYDEETDEYMQPDTIPLTTYLEEPSKYMPVMAPSGRYCCANEYCPEESSFFPDDLYYSEKLGGFYCAEHIMAGEYPSLADCWVKSIQERKCN